MPWCTRKTVLGQAFAWNRFRRDLVEVWGGGSEANFLDVCFRNIQYQNFPHQNNFYCEFPNLVVSNLVVCNFYAETLFCALFWSAANGGLRDGGLSRIQGNLRKKAFFLRFLDFPGALRAFPEKGEKGRKRAKRADFGRFPGRAARHPLSPHLLHPHLRQPNFCVLSAPRHSRVKFCVIFSVFHTVFDVKFWWWIFRRTPKPWENVGRKISPKFHAKFHDTFGREKRRKFSLPHFCRVAALTFFCGLAFTLTFAPICADLRSIC